MLYARSHSGVRVFVGSKENLLGKLPTIEQGSLNPVDADAEIAIAAKPMNIDPSALTLFNYS